MQQWKKRGTYHSVLEAIQEMSGLTEEELLSPSHIDVYKRQVLGLPSHGGPDLLQQLPNVLVSVG